ncbi:MAG: hypothetical protein V3T86_12610 [Planctomycetota bacterium]
MRTACLLLAFVSVSAASWTALEWGAAVAESDLVVVATLKRGKNAKPGQGTLHIEKVLLGKQQKTCTLAWTPMHVLAPTGTMRHNNRVGKRLVYLLQKNPDGSYKAGHPSRILPPKMLPEIRKAVQGPLYVLTLEKYSVKADEPVWAELEIRTALPKLQTDCWVRLSGDVLELGGHARLELLNPEEVPGKVRKAANPKRILITPDKPFRVRIDLRKYFDLKPETHYHLLFGEGPQRRSRRAVFRILK